jgi:twitching motility protein PilT
MNIEKLLELTVEKEASDLHLTVPSHPVLRIDGALKHLEELPRVTPEYAREALEHLTTESQRETLYSELGLDLAYNVPGLARFRINIFFQRGTISIAIRRISFHVPSIDELGLPSTCKTLALKTKGLVLVTGPAGTGKSTTLAAMINHLNKNDARHVITIEDPIEYIHHNDKCIISQRDLGDDFHSFSLALRHTLRHDPDVILIGEMRDLDTIAAAITAAETGHLVLTTVHTASAPQSVDRLIDIFPAHQQEQIRFQISQVLIGVLSQCLLPRAGGRGRIAAFEIMIASDAIRNLIREGRTDQIPTYLQTGRQHEMQTMDQALEDLVKSGAVTLDEALTRSTNPAELSKRIVSFSDLAWEERVALPSIR